MINHCGDFFDFSTTTGGDKNKGDKTSFRTCNVWRSDLTVSELVCPGWAPTRLADCPEVRVSQDELTYNIKIFRPGQSNWVFLLNSSLRYGKIAADERIYANVGKSAPPFAEEHYPT